VKRVVDVIYMQATDYYLLSWPFSPLKPFLPASVGTMTTEQLEKVAGDDTGRKHRR
jgi:hypothetical protein